MAIDLTKFCSRCHQGTVRRAPRNRLMRVLGITQHYACETCGKHSFRWLNRFWLS